MPIKNSIPKNMKYPNKHKVWAIWTDWNRAGKDAKGKYGGIGWYRIINPLSKIENVTIHGKFELGTNKRMEIAKGIKEEGDIMYVKYINSFSAINHLLTVRDIMHLKLVVDIDDNVFNVSPQNYAYKEINPNSEAYKAFYILFRDADALVCSTKPLAAFMRSLNPNVYVIPNGIDQDIWKVPNKKNEGKKIKIGWVYGPTHEQDVEIIVPVIKEIIRKYPDVEIHHIGWKSAVFNKLKRQKMVFGTSGYEEFPEFLAGLGIDILIAPLIDDEFNQGKSNIKFLEAAMCEIPMVASDVNPYSRTITNGKDGYLASRTSEWIKYLSVLIESKEKRIEIGKKAKKTALKYDVNNFLPDYVKLFDDLLKPEPEVTVVVTRRRLETDEITVKSLERQSYKGIKSIIRVEDVHQRGANWARNHGFDSVRTPYVLFSDNDINWKPWAVKKLVRALEANPNCSYAYGAYMWKIGEKSGIACNEHWSEERLRDYKKGNFVSTMSLVRTKDFIGFDENTKRLQDWDLWLSMLPKKGIYCGDLIFDTEFKQGGISADNSYTYDMALEALVKKHKL